jgi:hypothetical protein
MSVVILRLLVDFGLLVLIWIIQLIIYPGFLYYNTENLVVWHKKYTPLIGYIVAPLMISQLGIAIYQTTSATNPYNLISLVIISIVWISTFLQFIPIHNNISKGRANNKMLSSLVKKNWLRTVLWTILFLFSLANYAFLGV